MDEKRSKPPRNGGPKPAGGSSRSASGGKTASGGKPPRKDFDKKPFKKREFAGGDKPFGAGPRPDRKPYEKREAGAGESRSERPARKFEGGKPYGTGARPDRKPYEKREAGAGESRSERPASKFEGGKPYGTGARPDRKPYEKREAGAGESRSERPARKFEGGKPYGTGARPDRKPYEKREAGAGDSRAERPARKPYEKREGSAVESRAERPARKFDGDKPFSAGPRPERKPFVKREAGASESRSERPVRKFEGGDAPRPAPRFERSDAPRREGDRPDRGPKPGGFKSAGDRAPYRPRPSTEGEPGEGERIAKRLARAGIASRRDAEELIAAGRVRVNGQVLTTPAFNVGPEDRIELDNTEIPAIERTRLFLFHKPAGVVTTNRDPEGRRTVFDALPAELPRLMTIGRLDITTEGLLLLTNDGGLSRVLELPATGWLRRYRARVHGKVDEKALLDLKDGIAVDGVFYGGIEASLDREQGSNAWLTIGLREGKNREVKNILGALGLDVTRLIRISYGPFQLGELAEGAVQEMNGRTLRDQLGERLIEESGANFDAPIAVPFSNKPVRRQADPVEEVVERPKIVRDGEQGRIGEGGLIKNRKRERGREDFLGQLSTSPERGGKFGDRGPKPERGARPAERGPKPERGARPPRAGKSEREQRPIEPPATRKANVWMAPGARPLGKARLAENEARPASRRGAKPFGEGKPRFDKPRSDRPRGERPNDGRPPRGDRPSSGPRKGK